MAVRKIETKLTLDGEREWRSQMQNVNSALKTTKSELALTSSQFRDQANSVAALTAKQELLQQQYDQQAEKVGALRDALKEAEKVYSDSPEKVDKYRQMLNAATVQLNNMSDELAKNSKYLKEAEESQDGCATSIDQFGKEIKEAEEKTLSFGDVLKANLTSEAIIGGIKAMASAFQSAAGAVKDLVTESAAYADDILTTATVTGLSTDALQEYRYMAELTDVSMETVTGSLSKLTRNMSIAQDGTGDAAEAFKKLGVSVEDQSGALRSNQDVFAETLDALAQIENETERDALAMSIFGKSAQDLNPLLAVGADGLAAYAQEARDMGYVLSEESLSALGAVDDSMQRFSKALEGAKNNLADDFAPSVSMILDGITAVISGDVEKGADFIEQGVQMFGETLENLGPYAEVALKLLADTLLASLPELLEIGADLLVSIINGFAKTAPELVPVVIDAILTIVTTLLSNSDLIMEAGVDLIISLAVGLVRAIPQLAEKLPQIIAALVNGLGRAIVEVSRLGGSIIEGLWSGLGGKMDWLRERVMNIGQTIVGGLKDFFGIRSPASKHMPFIGQMQAEGLAIGFEGRIGSVTDDMADELARDMNKSMSSIPTSFDISASVNAAARYSGLGAYSTQVGNMDAIALLQGIYADLRALAASDRAVVLEDGTIVGRWAPMIDAALGQLALEKERG